MQKTFYVYESKEKSGSNYVFIKKGFSFYAFFLNIIWLAHNKIWNLFFILFSFLIILNVFKQKKIIDENEITIINFGIMLLLGFSSCDIKSYYFEKKGYKKNNTIISNNLLEAKKNFYSSLNK